MTTPVAGNQFFTGVQNLAGQLPHLNVSDLTAVNATVLNRSV